MVISTTEKIKCDVKDCKRDADCYIFAKGKVGKFFLCKDSAEKLCRSLVARSTPKSPKNTIKKIIDEKNKER